MFAINNQKLIEEALGVELKKMDKDAALCVLLEKNTELNRENKKLKKVITELTREVSEN